MGPQTGAQGSGRVGTLPPSLLVFMSLFGPSVPSDCGLGARSWSEPGSQKSLGDGSPQQEPEPSPDTVDTVDTVVLSLCGGLADSGDISVGMLDYGLCLLRPGPEQGTGEGRETPEVGAVEVCVRLGPGPQALGIPKTL